MGPCASRNRPYLIAESMGDLCDRFFVVLTLLITSIFYTTRAQSTLSFCDNDELFIINEGDCVGGINFGTKKPDCVCLTGVYRSWAEGCELYDGFINEFCTHVKGDDLNIVGIKLINGIVDVYRDTAAIFGDSDDIADNQNWAAYMIGMEGITKSDSFYTLNGFPVVLANARDRFICVEPQSRRSQQVCRFFAYENKEVWLTDNERMKIKIMRSCDPRDDMTLSNYTVAELKAHRCYDIMDKNVSECQLHCGGGRRRMLSGSTGPRAKKSLTPSEEEIDGGEDDEAMTAVSSEVVTGSNNANFNLHRKLNKHIRMRQVGLLQRPDLSQTAPNRTFTLLDIATRIVRSRCPTAYVSDIFLEHALELFVVLHRGQDLRYIEDIEWRDYKWIEEILLSCRKAAEVFPFEGEQTLPGCEDNGLISKTCPIVDGDIRVCHNLVGGLHHQTGKYHYIIDAIWNIIDMTHVICYPSFVKSFRMFHIWEQASEKLFTRDIKEIWHKPNIDLRIYDSMLSSRSMADMINLERCVEAAYSSYSLPRLVRPPVARRHFKRRKRALNKDPPSLTKSVDVYCAKTEGDFIDGC